MQIIYRSSESCFATNVLGLVLQKLSSNAGEGGFVPKLTSMRVLAPGAAFALLPSASNPSQAKNQH
ncbi:hypothetical protein MJO29_012958 [Puccinia striiformis f. sp. tritici]|nr:hypothetical protein MJO29_012958 [Puccinia striiformis f. sp. tritici]